MERLSIKTIEVGGFASAIAALHLPMGKDPDYMPEVLVQFKPITGEDNNAIIQERYFVEISPKEMQLMTRLIKAGDEHAKCIRGIRVGVIIKAPIWFYRELETYSIGRTGSHLKALCT